jgi:hypothetical protein
MGAIMAVLRREWAEGFRSRDYVVLLTLGQPWK